MDHCRWFSLVLLFMFLPSLCFMTADHIILLYVHQLIVNDHLGDQVGYQNITTILIFNFLMRGTAGLYYFGFDSCFLFVAKDWIIYLFNLFVIMA